MDIQNRIVKIIYESKAKNLHEWLELNKIIPLLSELSQSQIDTFLRELSEKGLIEFPKGGEHIRNCFRLTLAGKEQAKLIVYNNPYLAFLPTKIKEIEKELDDCRKKLPTIGKDGVTYNFISSRITRLESAVAKKSNSSTNVRAWIALIIAGLSLAFSILYNLLIKK